LVLDESLPERFTKGRKGSLLLQKPNRDLLTLEELKNEIEILFGLYGLKFYIKTSKGDVKDIKLVNGKTLLITKNNQLDNKILNKLDESGFPYSNYANCEFNGKKFSVFFENPVGNIFANEKYLENMLKIIYPDCKNVKDVKVQLKAKNL